MVDKVSSWILRMMNFCRKANFSKKNSKVTRHRIAEKLKT